MASTDALIALDIYFLAKKINRIALANAAERRLNTLPLRNWPRRLTSRPDCELLALEELVRANAP